VTTLLIVVSVSAGSIVGWYGHKAIARIQAWGERMNEQDLIFQAMSAPEEWPEQALQPQPPKVETKLSQTVTVVRA
jgi:hypothetical protein